MIGKNMPPGRTALYRLFDREGTLLYVGITHDPQQRAKAHRTRQWWPQVAKVKIQWHRTRLDAHRAERVAIHDESPRYNIAETPLHRRLAEHRHHPLATDERAAWANADTGGYRAWAVKDGRIPE